MWKRLQGKQWSQVHGDTTLDGKEVQFHEMVATKIIHGLIFCSFKTEVMVMVLGKALLILAAAAAVIL